tara:strand:+ start:543 stop:1166 length:624 start_codon:yes stop_codon:yes gene_type:complete
MAIKRTAVKQASTAPTDVLPADDYEARLVYVADLGIQKGNPKYDQKDNQQLALCLEVIGHTREFEGETVPEFLWGRGFNIFQKLNELGNEYKNFKIFDPSCQEGDVADWDNVLGVPCSVTTVINDRGYAEVSALNPLPKKYHGGVGESLVTDMSTGDVDDEDNPAQKAMYGLPRWLVDNNRVGHEEGKPLPAQEAVPSPIDDDDIPF